jgi:hypothetical protein
MSLWKTHAPKLANAFKKLSLFAASSGFSLFFVYTKNVADMKEKIGMHFK